MDLIATPVAMLTILTMSAAIFVFSLQTPLGAMSLPAMTMLIALINFFIMPALALANGDEGFFGMYITSLVWMHVAVALYCIGASLACAVFLSTLKVNPAAPRPVEREINNQMYIVMFAACAIMVALSVAMGRLNITASENYQSATESGDYLFIALGFPALIPLTLVYVIRSDFSPKSLMVALLVAALFLQSAFRYRIMLLGFSLTVSFLLVHNFKIRLSYVLTGLLGAVLATNIIGNSRTTYGQGIDLSLIENMSFTDLLQSFGGEIGPIYVFSYTTETPLPDPIGPTPWLVALARLVPSFVWPDKPKPEYMDYFVEGFPDKAAKLAGIAAPQHVEMLMQFGWIGLPVLAFIYFAFACFLIKRFHRLSREARIAGCSIAPAFFGFYMQNRGYFFQAVTDGLALFGPLFLLHLGRRGGSDAQPR